MKKTIKSTDERNVGYGNAYIIKSDNPDYLVGRLLTVIEAVGLPEKQEKSLKDLIRFEVYNSLNLSNWVPAELHNIIVDFHDWYQAASPIGQISGSVRIDPPMKGEFTLTYQEEE